MSQGFAKSEDAVNDHGQLDGLADDDHTQYLNDARHNNAHGAGRWTRSTTQAITTGTFTTVIWDSVVREDDPDGDFTMNTGTGVVTINNAGWYQLGTGVETQASGVSHILLVRLNGAAIAGNESPGVSTTTRIAVGTMIYCAAADTIDVRFWHNQGSDLNVRAAAPSYFAIAKVRE